MKNKFIGSIVATSLIATTMLNAKLTDEDILKQFSAFLDKGISTEIVSRSKFEGTPFEKVLLSFNVNKKAVEYQTILVLDDYIIGDATDAKTSISLNAQANDDALLISNLAGLYKMYNYFIKENNSYPDDANITALAKKKKITLGSNSIFSSKKTVVYFSDPVCPFCRAALNNIEQMLDKYNIILFLTPITSHWGQGAIELSQKIEDEIKPKMSDKEKIDILRKYYKEDAVAPKISNEQRKAQEKLIKEVINTKLLAGEPSYLELDLLIKASKTFNSLSKEEQEKELKKLK